MPTVNLGIISSVPWGDYNPYTNAWANIYVDMLKEICQNRGIPFLDLYYESNLRPWEPAFRQAMYTRDNGHSTHPDENGHKLFAPRIEAFLDKLLQTATGANGTTTANIANGHEINLEQPVIVSAVVNQNGTITLTLSDGSAITTTGTSVIGPQGPAGQNYILTAQDKSDIAALVLAQLPTTQGVQYGNTSN